MRACVTLAVACLLLATTARADEVRLRSGEVLFGRVEADAKGDLVVISPAYRRKVRAKEVEERIEGEAPQDELARRAALLGPDDAEGRVALARFAWSRRLEMDAIVFAEAASAIDPDHVEAHAWLGQVRGPDGWTAAWPPAWSSVLQRWKPRAEDPAVRRALDWLAAHQDESGRLDADGFSRHCPEGEACDGPGGGHHGERGVACAFDGATTAVAVMAWLADGSGPTAGRYKDPVARGLAFCRRTIQRSGGFDGIWNLAYATQAVADAALHAYDPALLDDARAAARRLLAMQRADGGWSYVYAVGDVPTTSAVLVALGLCVNAGVAIERAPIERALAFLEARVDSKTAKSEYHDGAEKKGYTPTSANAAATLAARRVLGVLGETPGLSRRIAAAAGKKKPRWKIEFKEVETGDGRTVRAQIGNLYPYAWYLAGLALAGRSASAARAKGFAVAFRKGQRTEGHAAGSWEPLGQYSLSGGRAFVTGLGALTILAPARYPGAR